VLVLQVPDLIVAGAVRRGEHGAGDRRAPSLTGNADRVRQLWEISEDGGVTWSTLFDGRYSRDRDAEMPG
jgi:hypothetical protein